MDSDTWLQIVLLVLFIAGASYFAASEISYAAMNRIRVENYANRGDPRARKAIYILDHFEQAMTTLLIGNNITHIGFASLATYLSTQLWGIESVKYTAIGATVVVFLVSELIPKSYAKENSEKYALAVSRSLYGLIRIMTPVTRFFTFITGRLMAFMPEGEENGNMSEEEFNDIVAIVQSEEVLDEETKKLFNSAVSFDNILIGDIMTPLEAIECIGADDNADTILNEIRDQSYSRFPVCDGDLDHIVGILQATCFIKKFVVDPGFEWRSTLSEPFFVKRDILADDLLKEMNAQKFHMAIVTDESDRTVGLITLEDILEELVGEIWDESDTPEDEMTGGQRS